MRTMGSREWVLHASVWALFAYFATPFGVLCYVFAIPTSHRSVLAAVASGVLFGILMTVWAVRQRKEDFSRGRVQADRLFADMLRTGQRPDDTGDRGRLIALIARRKAASRRTRRISAPLFGVCAIVALAQGRQSHTWLVIAAGYVIVVTGGLVADMKNRRDTATAERLVEGADIAPTVG
jgi:hypothetical protein